MAMLGLDSPLVRWMMSGAQTSAMKSPVNNMGIGIQSGAQRMATGNKVIKAGSREALALAEARKGIKVKKDKKYKKGKSSQGKGVGLQLPDQAQQHIPVELPVPVSEEQLGLV